jgi:hypothetical protein
LAGIARNGRSDQARVAAAQALLDRGWGKPAQTHTGEDGGGPIQVILRHIVDTTADTEQLAEPALIEHERGHRA